MYYGELDMVPLHGVALQGTMVRGIMTNFRGGCSTIAINFGSGEGDPQVCRSGRGAIVVY